MANQDLDPERRIKLAHQLKALGVRGILVTAAEKGYITELACKMPDCLCPKELGGRTYFDAIPDPPPDWMPTPDHIKLKSEGGQLTLDNVRLAHRLCNRVDYAKNHAKPYARDLMRVEAARVKAIRRTDEIGVPRDERWPGRRERILGQIAQLWAQWPDMRFGQLIENFLSDDASHLFGLEDDETERRLDLALRHRRGIP